MVYINGLKTFLQRKDYKMIKQTQLESYHLTDMEMGDRQREVLDIVQKHGPIACFQVAAIARRKVHAISGRITELERAGRIEPSGKKIYCAETDRDQVAWQMSGNWQNPHWKPKRTDKDRLEAARLICSWARMQLGYVGHTELHAFVDEMEAALR